MLSKKEIRMKRKEFDLKRMELHIQDLELTIKLYRLINKRHRYELWKMAQLEKNGENMKKKENINPLHI